MQMLSYAHLEGRNPTPTNSSCLSRLQYSGICSLFPSRPSGHHEPLWSMSMTSRRHSGCSFRLSTQSPIPNPLIDNTETFASVLRLADKYDAKAVFDACNYYLPSIHNNSPLQSYGILCACGREKEARAVARRAPFTSSTCPGLSPLLDLMTTKQYHRLMSFMVARDRRTRQIVSEHQAEIRREGSSFCRDDIAHQLCTGAITASIQAAFEENPCVQVVEALGIVSSAPVTFSPCKASCKYNMNELRLHAEGLLEELVEMAENLPWVD